MARYNDDKDVSEINKIIPKKYRLKCKNEAQKEFSKLIAQKEIVFGYGCAGTGKSFVSLAKAIELMQTYPEKYKKIIISKPAIEAGEKHGFLPGDLMEKMHPYIASSLNIINKVVGSFKAAILMQEGYIEIQPLAYIRGMTIENSILIMEEAQNMSPEQMKTLLTRIGEDSKYIITGDLDQSDRYYDYKQSGLYDAVVKHQNIDEIGFMEFTTFDVVRNPLIMKIIRNYTPKPYQSEEE